jgi:hypothetical protein
MLMNLWQPFFEALESLSANKLRSGLTILGIVIGVAAVIAMISIGRGAENSITGSIQGIGTNLLFVFRGGSDEVRNPKPLTLGDASHRRSLPGTFGGRVAPILQGSGKVAFSARVRLRTHPGCHAFLQPCAEQHGQRRRVYQRRTHPRAGFGRSAGYRGGRQLVRPHRRADRGDGPHRRPSLPRHRHPGGERRFFL